MKAILATLLLTALGLAAQIPALIPAPPASPPGALGAGPGPTRDASAQGLASAGGRAAAAARRSAAAQAAKAAAPVPPANAAAAGVPGADAAVTTDTAALSALVGSAAHGDEIVPSGMLKLQKADADQVLDVYSILVGRTALRPATLANPQITFMPKTELTVREAIQALDVVFGMNGIGLVPVGEKFIKAVPIANVNQIGAKFFQGSAEQLPEMGQYVTHIVQLKYAKPSEMIQALTPFASQIPNPILAIDSSAILILRDFAENVKRMLELIARVDVSIPSEFVNEVIPIKYALASDIAGALNSLSTGGGGSATVGGGGLSGSRGGSTGSRGGAFGSSRGGLGVSGSGTGMGGVGGMGGMGGMGAGMNQMGATTPGAAGNNASFTDRIRGIIGRSGAGGGNGSGDIQVIGQTKIISDERTNSLLIYATREDMKTIKKIIEQLDVVLSQVLIEAVILEVSLDDSKSWGTSMVQREPHGFGNYFKGSGLMNNGNNLSPINPFSGLTNSSSSGVPGGFSYLGSFGNDLDVTITALQSYSKTRILQRPRIQTSHAVQASLFVGESVPYPTGSYYGGGAYGGYSSIQQMQIGVSIDVTPLINPDGLVVMDIHTKIDSVSGEVSIANIGNVPITSSKEAQAKVAVRDHDTIMLGGLIDTSKSHTDTGVPVLKDIPVIGNLFKSVSKDDSRDELIILIRPTVLPTPEVAALARRSEMNTMPGVRSAAQELMMDEQKKLREIDKTLKGKEELDIR